MQMSFMVRTVLSFCLFSQVGFAGPQESKKDIWVNIKVGSQSLKVEVADSAEESARGLMERKSLGADEGMLFVFDGEEVRTFWMKNTYIPLSIGFFDSKKKLVDIQDMVPVKSAVEIPSTYQSTKPAKYALEVNQGWFKKHKVALGSRLSYSEK